MNQKTTEVQIKPAKGRPMLTWVGKRPLRNVLSYPAQLVETYCKENQFTESQAKLWQDWPADYPKGGLLFHGDNKEVLAHLLANGFRGKVKLIYIDPPFDSGADYVRKITLRGASETAKVDSEGYTIGEQIQYSDIWANDNYLQFMYERLVLLKELLSEDGSIYLHCDWHKTHYLRCLMDEIFGADNFRNEIIWKRQSAHNDSSQFGAIHDTILYYSKTDIRTWNVLLADPSPDYIEQFFDQIEPETNRRYARGDLTAGGLSGGGYEYEYKGVLRVWRCPRSTLERLESEGRLHWPKDGVPRLKRYLDEFEGVPLQDVWHDLRVIHNQSNERTGYPTQKPEIVMERIIRTSSNPGDLVLDCFIGSGTTAIVAQKFGRRWIGCDINKGAIQITCKRVMDLLKIQDSSLKNHQPLLIKADDEIKEQEIVEPAQLSFAIYKVNDYELQIQQNEVINLACEHIGITRTKTDAFFDGTLGKRLVKIIPFNHPLSPLDLEEIKTELGNRPEEGRDIVVVSLGKELAVEAWIEDWNRLRKQGDFPNKIEGIELRSDPRYGGFFTHLPDQAKIKVQRTEKGIEITVESFISPTIVERLKQQAGVLAPQIDDWRAMVDSIMIDTAYDGVVFNVVLADVPEKKSDLVKGKYTLEVPETKTTIAVKITDMLGEEVLVTNQI